MRELREFRAHHDEFVRDGIAVAGMSRDSVESNRHWVSRLELPFPVLSDRDGTAAAALCAVRRVPIGGWTLELARRMTFLVDLEGRIAAVWERLRIRGHASEVLRLARAAKS